MGANTKIEWCDHTFNPWLGCTKVSPGCEHCYAESWAKRTGIVRWGAFADRRRTRADNWNQVRKWNAAAAGIDERIAAHDHSRLDGERPRRPRVFCASLADWLDDAVPVEWLADLLELIGTTPNLDWLLLSKRPQNWSRRIHAVIALPMGTHDEARGFAVGWFNGTPPANVWLGTTVEDQRRADERIPVLLSIPARVRFLSCEPLLRPVDLGLFGTLPATLQPHYTLVKDEIHWVICGGESGPKARPMRPEWARSLRDQCQAAGVPYLFKQWGEWAPYAEPNTMPPGSLWRAGKHEAGRLLDGVEHNGFPDIGGRS